MSPSAPDLEIDVFADLACPWCYIGERRLFTALASRPDLEFVVRWRPFQLQPHLPPEGRPWPAFAEAKFGGMKQAQEMFAHVAAAGQRDEIAFDFNGIAAAVNTADAHRLILFGRQHGAEWTVATHLFRAYFEDGVNIGDRGALVSIARQCGLPADAASAWLSGNSGLEEVEESQQRAAQMGIDGVPFFIFGRRFALSGAQAPEVFTRAIEQLAEAEAGETQA